MAVVVRARGTLYRARHAGHRVAGQVRGCTQGGRGVPPWSHSTTAARCIYGGFLASPGTLSSREMARMARPARTARTRLAWLLSLEESDHSWLVDGSGHSGIPEIRVALRRGVLAVVCSE